MCFYQVSFLFYRLNAASRDRKDSGIKQGLGQWPHKWVRSAQCLKATGASVIVARSEQSRRTLTQPQVPSQQGQGEGSLAHLPVWMPFPR